MMEPALRVEDQRGLDQRKVGEGLREVAELTERNRVVLLREQPDVVSQVEQALEQLARLPLFPLQGEDAGEPERAGKEDAFAAAGGRRRRASSAVAQRRARRPSARA